MQRRNNLLSFFAYFDYSQHSIWLFSQYYDFDDEKSTSCHVLSSWLAPLRFINVHSKYSNLKEINVQFITFNYDIFCIHIPGLSMWSPWQRFMWRSASSARKQKSWASVSSWLCLAVLSITDQEADKFPIFRSNLDLLCQALLSLVKCAPLALSCHISTSF